MTTASTIQPPTVNQDAVLHLTRATRQTVELGVDHEFLSIAGHDVRIGFRKLTEGEGVEQFEVRGKVVRGGKKGQRAKFSIPAIQTRRMALDDSSGIPAYRWTIAAYHSPTRCPTLAYGYASVKVRDTTCA